MDMGQHYKAQETKLHGFMREKKNIAWLKQSGRAETRKLFETAKK